MENLDDYINFVPEYTLNKIITPTDLCFIYSKNRLLLKKSAQLEAPCYDKCQEIINHPDWLWELGTWHGVTCFAYPLDAKQEDSLTKSNLYETLQLEWVNFRDARWSDAMELYQIAVKTQHLLNWDRTTKYCGCCGSLYERKPDERAKKCPNCGHLQFPRISPAIIVGIKKGDEILMAHNTNFREGLYSVIAGFVEQGETLEMAVKREIYEEVGLKVKNIQYFHSRPWNSIDSLMLGFTAEYESGEIKVDGKEIVDAKWCDKAHMPKVLPDKISTAWHIINSIMHLEP